MLHTHDQPLQRQPNSPIGPADGTDAADEIAAEIARLEAHDEDEERRLIRYIGTMEPCQIPRLLRMKSKFRAQYNLTERVGLFLAAWHLHKRRSRYMHGAALVAWHEQRERGRLGNLRAKLMSCYDEIAALHDGGMSYTAIAHELKRNHEKLFRGLKIDEHYLARIMRSAKK